MPARFLAHVIGTDDFAVAQSIYRAALKRWPNSRVIPRQGAHGVYDSGPRSVMSLSSRCSLALAATISLRDCAERSW
jgi:hypothetical protein